MSADKSASPHAPQGTPGRKEAVVLVNTLAPQASAFNWVEACSARLGPEVHVREVRVTGFEAVRKAAQEAADAAVWLIIVVGGDGTVNSVINGVGTKPTRIAVLPGGTSNDIAYQLGQSSDLAANIAALGQLEPFEFDAMRINGVRFAIISAFGYPADGVATFNRLRGKGPLVRFLLKHMGPAMYIFIYTWLAMQARKLGGAVTIRYRDLKDNVTKTLETDVIALLVMGVSTGVRGHYKFAPDSDMTDGVMELWMCKRCSTSRVFKYVSALEKGTALELPEVSYLRSDRFEVEWKKPLDYIVDGDPILGADPNTTKYTFELDPTPIRVLTPRLPRRGTLKK